MFLAHLLPLAHVVGCLLAAIAPATAPTTAPTTLRSEDGSVEVQVPGDWECSTPQWASHLYVGTRKTRLSARIMPYLKQDIANLTQKDLEQRAFDDFSKGFTNVNRGEAKTVKVNGEEALSAEWHGELKDEKWVCSFVVIETPKAFVCIYFFCLPSRYEESRSIFDAIASSVRVAADQEK